MTPMNFQQLKDAVTWHLHLQSCPEKVYAMIASGAGRAKFWAEAADEVEGQINWRFPNGYCTSTEIFIQQPPTIFSAGYIGGSRVTFELQPDPEDGTDLTLIDQGIDPAYVHEVAAGWVSVLMALKGAVDFGVDLRNHDPKRTWEHGYLDN